MPSVASALTALGLVARAGELRALGVTARQIARAVTRGEVVVIRRGLYAASDIPDRRRHAAEHGGALACHDAGRACGLWILDPPGPLHVWIGNGGRRATCPHHRCGEIRWHWDEGIARPGTLPPVHNVLLQIAHCGGEEAFFVALASALRTSLISPSGLQWLRRHLPADLRWLVSFARADADRGLESLIRLRLHHLGIAVRPQVRIDGVGEADFLIGDRLLIEADGRQNHDDIGGAVPSRRHKDLRRDARAAALGYETLRFDYAMIVHDWPTVAAAILARVRAGAHLR